MSEATRYKTPVLQEPSGNLVKCADQFSVVHAHNYDVALIELAALREELEIARGVMASQGETIGRVISERYGAHKRLTAVERRNATLVKAATEFMEYAESGWDHFPDVGVNLRAALAQPTESGASE